MNNSKPPLISVIIPCYNVSLYVEKAIISILTQSYCNLEIWIIDDASTDDSLEKINAINDDRIQVVAYKKNTQKVGAVNEVLKKVNGDLICFQDADDWSQPNRVEEQVQQFLKDSALGICFTNYRYTGARSTLPGRIALTHDELCDEFFDFFKNEKGHFSPTACPTMMITRNVLQRTGGYNSYFAGKVAEDIQWIYRILKEFKGITVNKILYNYSIRAGSFTQIQSDGENAKYCYSWQLLRKIINKDIHENLDVLNEKNEEVLKKLELEACEEALVEKIKLLKEIRFNYENSTSYKLGKIILTPWHILKSLIK